ncbi:PEP-CTERM sorting domain-containing protein [Desulfovibrio sp. DV]|uniref:PEP-CTERM sorting domain-containing protein n=1 Tax=Desulfovibrio sp. DV TaxID=1844708 RepID=UPI00094B7F77|nr:PEP-CTERM sorting domain-containing protein [Desulfovibrio sp. DV]
MKRLLLLSISCLLLLASSLHASMITEDESTFGDTLGDAFVINTGDFYYDSDFTKETSTTWDTDIQGSYSGRNFDYFQLAITRDTNAYFSLSNSSLTTALWRMKSDGSWEKINTYGLSFGSMLSTGTYVLGIAGSGAGANNSGFSGGSNSGGAYNLNISLSPVATPEPSAFLLTGLGLIGLFGARKKFSRNQKAA